MKKRRLRANPLLLAILIAAPIYFFSNFYQSNTENHIVKEALLGDVRPKLQRVETQEQRTQFNEIARGLGSKRSDQNEINQPEVLRQLAFIGDVTSGRLAPSNKTYLNDEKLMQALNELKVSSVDPATFRIRSSEGRYLAFSSEIPLGFNTTSDHGDIHQWITDREGLFGIGEHDQIKLQETHADKEGKSVSFRLSRTFKGKPVWGNELGVEIKNGHLTSVQGRFLTIPGELDTNEALSLAEIKTILPSDYSSVELADTSLESGIYIVSGVAHFTQRVLVNRGFLDSSYIYVLPNSKRVLSIVRRSADLSASKGKDLLGITRNFNSALRNGVYVLEDADVPGISSYSGVYQYDSATDSINTITSSSPDNGWDRVAVSAMYNSRVVAAYFNETHNRKGLDGRGARLHSIVNFAPLVADADEQFNLRNNALWAPDIQSMIYGKGDPLNNFAIALDVAAHEFSHGVINNSSNLAYKYESGALNESFADLMGVMVDRDDWLIGEELSETNIGERSFKDPAARGQPSHYNRRVISPNTQEGDWGGVHYNSGIQNRAFYLIAEGLSQEGLGESIGRAKTEKIAYRTMVTLTPTSAKFIDSAAKMIDVAEQEYGLGSAEAEAVQRAWELVGISVETTPIETAPDAEDQFRLQVGVDFLVHLYPQDGTLAAETLWEEDYDVYLVQANQPYEGYNSDTLIGPINDTAAQPIRPTVATSESGDSFLAYLGTDGNLYLSGLSEDSEDTVLDLEDDFAYVALAQDASKIAFVTIESNIIWVYDFKTERMTWFEVEGPSYSAVKAQSSVKFVDSISFDHTSRKLAFDYLSCAPIPDEEGSCVDYWSIGILDLSTGFSYPFPSQNPEIDLGFPRFSNLSNSRIVFDFIDWGESSDIEPARSLVLTFDAEAQNFTTIADSNGSEKFDYNFAKPSFIGDDVAITFQFQLDESANIWQSNINDNLEPVGDEPFTQVLPYDSGFATPHRNSYQRIEAKLVSDTNVIELGPILPEESSRVEINLQNDGNRTIQITAISSSSSLYTNLNNRTLDAGTVLSFYVELDDRAPLGLMTDTLIVAHDGDNASLEIGFSAYIDADSDSDGVFNSKDDDDDNDGVPDADDAFPLDIAESTDNDEDGIGDFSDNDDDNDGLLDINDPEPLTPNVTDTDNDGVLDVLDDDDDDDGYLDNDDAFPLDPSEARDLDGNGIGDKEDAVGALRDRLELNILDQRMVSYLGRVAVNLMSDLEDNLLFGESEDWTAARGSTEAGSLLCADGGGYDISVTRSDFTTLSGTLTAENCKFLGLTVSGTVAFEYEDEYWFQDTPMQHYPLTMTFTNAQIKDELNRLFTYSGAASCDWRFNNSARTYSRYVHGPDSPYNFGEKYDGALIAVYETGSRFDAGGEGWQQQSSGLEVNSGGTTDIYPFEYPNCDFENTAIVHVGKTYGADRLKYIGEYGGAGYRITTLTRQQRKSNDQPFTLDYAINLETGEVLYNPPTTGITPERFSHPELGQFSFSAGGGNPGTYQWASRNDSDINFYQSTSQRDHQYLIYLSDESDEFSANNIYTPWGEAESWNLGVDLDQDGVNDRVEGWAAFSWLWTDGTCGWYINRYQGVQLFEEYRPNDLGICQRRNGFYIDSSGKTQFSDVNGDGNNELFDVDDDDDGYLDFADAFPLDATEWLDSDGDGLGDNADVFPSDETETVDSDGDGVGDNKDAFPNDRSETLDSDGDSVGDNADAFPFDAGELVDTDADGLGNNADLDDDNDGFTDEEESAARTDPLSASSCPGCFNWDVDDDGEAKALTDGLLVIRHLFGFSGEALTAGAVGSGAKRSTPADIAAYLTNAATELDIDGDDEAKALTDGLLLIRYLFGFTGNALAAGAVGEAAERATASAIQAYIAQRLPDSNGSASGSDDGGGLGSDTGDAGGSGTDGSDTGVDSGGGSTSGGSTDGGTSDGGTDSGGDSGDSGGTDGGSAGTKTIEIDVVYDRVPYCTSASCGSLGLDYAKTVQKPVRFAKAAVLDADSKQVLMDNLRTDAAGRVSFSVAVDQAFIVRVYAESSGDGAASWGLRIVDNNGADQEGTYPIYVLESGAINANAVTEPVTLQAESGWGLTKYTQTRSAAPFAILDSMISATLYALSGRSTLAFAPVDVYWSVANTSDSVGTSYYSGSYIMILGDAEVDTDEYDESVIVHEWGHYFQSILSKDDSVGGSHGGGDLLDMRVAFSEGWANAYSGLATARDAYIDTSGSQQAGGFGIALEGELNARAQGAVKGWYSEDSAQYLVYDLFDDGALDDDNCRTAGLSNDGIPHRFYAPAGCSNLDLQL